VYEWTRSYRAVFVYGIAENNRGYIGEDKLATLREIGAAWLAVQSEQLDHVIKFKPDLWEK
jgi:hypothetical protein